MTVAGEHDTPEIPRNMHSDFSGAGLPPGKPVDIIVV
jgi:hypothetical protein